MHKSAHSIKLLFLILVLAIMQLRDRTIPVNHVREWTAGMKLVERKRCRVILVVAKHHALVLFVHAEEYFFESLNKLSTLEYSFRNIFDGHLASRVVLILLPFFNRGQDLGELDYFCQGSCNFLLEFIRDAHHYSTDDCDTDQCEKSDLPLGIFDFRLDPSHFVVLTL